MKITLLDLTRQYSFMKLGIDRAIGRVVKTQQWVLGPAVEDFEKACADYLGVPYACGVNSGTDALVIALRCLAVTLKKKHFFSPSDEIITTPFTFVATGEAILRAGATPVFVDIGADTFNIDPEKIKKALTKRTVGILPVHLFGRPADMAALADIAKKNNLFIIEDCAQSFGAAFGGKLTGGFGSAGAFSFFPSKNLGGFGDGGLLSSHNAKVIELAKILRNHGGKTKYNASYLGYNSRLDSLQAAVLKEKLKYTRLLAQKRKAIAQYYFTNLKDLRFLILPKKDDRIFRSCWNQFTVRIREGMRDRFRDFLYTRGIQTAVYYPVSLNRMKLFKDKSKIHGSLRHTQTAAREVISLPMEPFFNIRELAYTVNTIRKFQ